MSTNKMANVGFELPPPVTDDQDMVFKKPASRKGIKEKVLRQPQDGMVSKMKVKPQPKEATENMKVKQQRTGVAADVQPQKKVQRQSKQQSGKDTPSAPYLPNFVEMLLDPRSAILPASPQDDVMELFSQPRLVPICQEMGLVAELSLDLKTGWDCSLPDMKTLALKTIDQRKPWVIMLSPPCTMYSALQRSNKNRVDPLQAAFRREEADGFMDFTKQVAVKQAESGRGFILEHPASASSWQIDCVQAMMALPNAQVSKFDQCRYGLRGPGGSLMRKGTKLLSNIPQIQAEFHGKACMCRQRGETHEQIQGSVNGVRRSTHAQVYPDGMVRALAGCCLEYVDMRHFLACRGQETNPVPSEAPAPSEGGAPESNQSNDVETAWGLESMEIEEFSEAKYAKDLMDLLQKAHSKYGGLEKFFQLRFQQQTELQSFADYLSGFCPCGSGHEYAVGRDMPSISPDDMVNTETLRIHPASFAFLDSATVRGPAESDVVMKLAEEILKDGLVTAGEALLLPQSEALTKEVLQLYGPDAEVAPKFAASLGNIRGYILSLPTKREEFLGNFKLSVRGSIRRAPNVVQQNNSRSTRAGQLLGQKAQSVRNVMEFYDPKALESIIAFTVEVGTEQTPWSDESLSSKKCLPGFQFRSTHGATWAARGTVTRKSNLLMVQHQIESHRQLVPGMRRKLEKQRMEQTAQYAAFVSAVADEVLDLIPVDGELLEKEWVNKWRMGEPGVCLEVESALLNKPVYTDPRDIQSIRSLMQQHSANVPLPSVPAVAMEQLQADTFDIKVRQIQYDLQAIRVARAKRQTWESQVYHAKLEYKMKMWEHSEKAAAHYLKNHSFMTCFKAADDLNKALQAYKTEVVSRLKIDVGASVCYLNWTAPSTIKNQTMAAQTSATSAILGDSMYNVGILLEPVFTYQKNSLWMLQNSCLKRLAVAGCTVDKGFVLQFKEKVDNRDHLRPLVYMGRILEGQMAHIPLRECIWKSSMLLKEGRTTPASQIATKEMLAPDLTDNALPGVADEGEIQGGPPGGTDWASSLREAAGILVGQSGDARQGRCHSL
ncbi:unnamed protein product [Durusdinium trenchii]|uniref:Uncharacterized protein n=1 Tax=Durusdinium trenchii TaxID=1381693 RepID=A0ABP0KZF3_9DINO